MKRPLLVLLLNVFVSTFQVQTELIREVRELYQEAPTERESCEELLELLESANQDQDPLLLGYKGSATMMMANHVFNPFTKLSYFNRGKDLLDQAVKTTPDNVELRLLRYSAQMNAPSFLGYNEYIDDDRKILIQARDTVESDLRKRIHSQLDNP